MKSVEIYYPNGAKETYSEGSISYLDDKKKIVSINLLQTGGVQMKFDNGSEKIFINISAVIKT